MTQSKDDRVVTGVDIFVEATFDEKLPSHVGSLKLSHVASRGTKLKGTELEKSILDVGWLCVRYEFENPCKPGTESDRAICQLIEKIGAQHNWSSLIKLYSEGGKPLYS